MSGDLDVRGGDVDMAIRGGVIVGTGDHRHAAVLEADGATIVPGFLDLQCNGVGGIHLTDEPERLWEASALLPRYGVTAWLPTIVSSPPERIERALVTLAHRPAQVSPIAEPIGLHLEGPFLSERHRGAHPADLLVRPEDRGWSRAGGVAIVTLAPELPGAIELASTLAGRGVVVSAGHTGASLAQMDAAIEGGVSMVTHLFNGMAGFHHREPSVPGAALLDDRLNVGVIADGVHLRPAAVLLAWRLLGERFVLVTDAVAALGVGDGSGYRLDDGTLAGADLGMDGAVRNLVTFTGCSLPQACAAASRAPAIVLDEGTRGHLRPGARGDLVVLEPDGTVRATVVAGAIAYQR